MPTKAELKANAAELRKVLGKIDKLTGGKSLDDRRREDRENKKASRAAVADVEIIASTPDEREWREMLETDIYDWMRFYGDYEFTREFTSQQRDMIKAILSAMTSGGDQAIAAPRGEGKTSITEWVVMFAVLTGLIRFAVIFAATGNDAESILDSIRERFSENELLRKYYHEVCDPVWALENTAQRARTQTVSGTNRKTGDKFAKHPSCFSWCGREISFPNVPGSPCSGSIIATRGLDASVRGMKRGAMRPEIAIIDDPDTDETVNSEDQALKLERKIDRNIAGLAGQKRRLGRVMLTTIQNRICVSHKFTDPIVKPSFHGRRFGFLLTPPAQPQLWEEYIAMRQADWQVGTHNANKFYSDHRAEMDAGAVVANPWRRGSDDELSALQFYYNETARLGLSAVLSEYQNDPPEDSGQVESGITPILIQRQLTGLDRGIIPDGCTVLTHTVDVGKWKLHWVVRAWKLDGTGYTIDYGVQDVHGAKHGAKETEGLDKALYAEILRRVDAFQTAGYCTTSGEMIRDPITLVDAGYRTHAIYAACAKAGIGVYPVMGFGKSAGCCGISFTPANRKSRDVFAFGEYWKQVRTDGNIRLVECGADQWKAWEHDRWATATDKPGCMFLYGQNSTDPTRMSADEIHHKQYAGQICAEVEIEEVVKGVLKRRWKAKGENHWLDASYYGCVAAAMRGVRLQGSTVVARSIPAGTVAARVDSASRPSPQEMVRQSSRPKPKDRLSPAQLAKGGR